MKISYTQCDICKEQIPDDIAPRSYTIEGIGVHKSVDLCLGCADKFMSTLSELFGEYSSVADLTLEDLQLSIRAMNCLKRAGINNAGDIADMTWEELQKVRNIGKTCAKEVAEKMYKYTGIVIAGAPLQPEKSGGQSK